MNKEEIILAQATAAILDKTGMQITFKPHGKASDGGYDIIFQNRDMLFL